MGRPGFNNGYWPNGFGRVTYPKYTAHVVENEDAGDGSRELYVKDWEDGMDWTEPLDGWVYVMHSGSDNFSPHFRNEKTERTPFFETPEWAK